MLAIDVKTIFLLLIVENLFTIVFFRIYIYFYHSRIRKLNKYVIARILQVVAWFAYFLEIRNLDPVTMAVANAFAITGIAMETYSLLTSTQGFVKKKFVTLLSIALASCILYTVFSTDLTYRVIIASSVLTILFGYAWLDFSLKKGRTNMQRSGGWIGFLIAILFLSRALHTYFLDYDLVLYDPRYFNSFAGVGLLIVSFAWPLIFLLLHKEDDENAILKKDRQISLQNRSLKSYNTAIDKFFRIVSHDLRTPMSSMISFLDLIENETKEKDFSNIETYLKLINQSAHESFILLDNLLHWSILQSRKNKVVFQSIQLNELINHIIHLFEINTDEKNIHVTKKIEEELVITSDKFMLETVLRNLFSNAIKYTHEGGHISINAHRVKNFVQIEVEDSGIGINPENIKKLFKIESNYTSEGTNDEKGTGLGLVLSQEFVKKINGKLEVNSEPGIGSTFRVILPLNENSN